jgi:hypothetical protein
MRDGPWVSSSGIVLNFFLLYLTLALVLLPIFWAIPRKLPLFFLTIPLIWLSICSRLLMRRCSGFQISCQFNGA